MNTIYQGFVKPLFFLLEPEFIHDRMLDLGNFFGRFELTRAITRKIFNFEDKALEREVCGIRFKNPVGLAAGFDKDAKIINILPEVGFGFMSVGTVTYKPYKGNPKPRIYRLPNSKAIVVYFGLKNIGVKEIIKRIKDHENKKKRTFPLFISIGKTNADYTSSEKAGIKDYCDCLREVIKAGVGDVYEINISCPNTFGGEPFTTPGKLEKLLKSIYELDPKKPIFLKMPIDKSWKEFKPLCDIAIKYGVDGVIIGNLQKNHKHKSIKDKIPKHVKGGISGVPAREESTELIKKTKKTYGNKIAIIGVGGIFSSKDARDKLESGADLVQLITGMIYEGPWLIRDINRGLEKA